ncbi:DUF4214 domain-containing protein [Pseudomonas asiatica]|jgi:hypothetical protein|uniref:DUF4214 domain-containing protein n=1 Tax=Pseudomonas asiatica TaxID=2219225 RepID=UPI0018ABCE25|nr:DUF4214 domain-containing protein [Pseudomonas asiatica]MBF8805685.1 DUF4214 domain-containing protein [Pseudomonas asiatica]
MTTPSNKTPVMTIGFVDTFENGHFSGWCYTTSLEQQEVTLKINSHTIKKLHTNIIREDVSQQLKIEPTACGFNFSIKLDDLPTEGCTISFHEPTGEKLLNNGLFTYEHGKIIKGGPSKPHTLPLGIRAYTNILNSAKSDISTPSFIDVAIAKLRFASNSTFVALSYILILGRTPDPDGFLNSLRADLSSDASRRGFLANMVSSAEFQSKRTIAGAIRDLGKIS